MTTAPHPPRAIIVGASSGIGEALARQLGAEGWGLGLAARRGERLATLAGEISSRTRGRTVIHRTIDLRDPGAAIAVAAMRHFEADGPGTSSTFPRWRLVVWLLRIFPDTS